MIIHTKAGHKILSESTNYSNSFTLKYIWTFGMVSIPIGSSEAPIIFVVQIFHLLKPAKTWRKEFLI